MHQQNQLPTPEAQVRQNEKPSPERKLFIAMI